MSLANLEGKYPSLFPYQPPRGGPGWYALLEMLCEALQARTGDGDKPPVVFLQAREKWGSLSVRLHPFSELDTAMIAYVEAVSQRVCEVCSAPGQLVTDGWHRTRCEKHKDTRPTWLTSAR